MPSLASELQLSSEPFEFHARLDRLADGLELLHESVDRLRRFTGRKLDDPSLTQLETALAEVGANVLTHGMPGVACVPVEYSLVCEDDTAVATFTDVGPAVHDHLTRLMPAPTSEQGRGLALARMLLDELGYRREADTNLWRLVKRL
jgi:serine/threonine-protein kinase RsbW